jgi:hypothetical protein
VTTFGTIGIDDGVGLKSDSRLGIVQLVLVLGAPIAFASLLKGNTSGCNVPLSNHLAHQPFILRKVMSSFSSLDDRRGCNLTVRSVQSTQWMRRYPLMTLAVLFALVQAPLSSQAAGEKKLEVFSWWTTGGEAAALDALFTVYNKQHPGVEIVNATVAGGGGSAARSPLHTRLAGGIHPTPGKAMSVGNYLASTWNPVTANQSQTSTRAKVGIRFSRKLS